MSLASLTRAARYVDLRQEADQCRHVEGIEGNAFMPAGKNASPHRAGVVIELHLHEGRAHARGLPGALARAVAEAGDAPGQPAEQSEAGEPQRNGDVEPAASAEHAGDRQRAYPATGLESDRESVRIGARKDVQRP